LKKAFLLPLESLLLFLQSACNFHSNFLWLCLSATFIWVYDTFCMCCTQYHCSKWHFLIVCTAWGVFTHSSEALHHKFFGACE
jgi:hypothetical protein